MARRIAASPAQADYDALDWHVSRPSIAASGAFSYLPGLDRHFMLVAGAGVVLRLRGDGADFTHRIEARHVPFAFRGDWEVRCELLDGPVEALSVLTRRGRYGASLAAQSLGETPSILAQAPRETLVAWCASGPVTAYGTWGTATLARDDAIVADEPAATELALAGAAGASATVILVRVSAP